MAVVKKDREQKISTASRTITADEVTIRDGRFMDDEGNIAERVAELLLSPDASFKVTIKFNLPEEEYSEEDYK